MSQVYKVGDRVRIKTGGKYHIGITGIITGDMIPGSVFFLEPDGRAKDQMLVHARDLEPAPVDRIPTDSEGNEGGQVYSFTETSF